MNGEMEVYSRDSLYDQHCGGGVAILYKHRNTLSNVHSCIDHSDTRQSEARSHVDRPRDFQDANGAFGTLANHPGKRLLATLVKYLL